MEWQSVISDFYSPFHTKVQEKQQDKQYSHLERTIGTDPESGDVLIAKFGQYGPYVQKGDGAGKQCASLGKGQLIENITLEEALKLFQLPRNVGSYNGVDIIALKGRFGPYLRYGDKNVSIPRGLDPLNITFEQCVTLIEDTAQKDAQIAVIKEFPGRDIAVMNGRYGPYIKHAGNNYKIPKGTVAASLTEAECQKIIDSAPAPAAKSGRYHKGRSSR